MAKAAPWTKTDAQVRKRQYRPRVLPSLSVFLLISAHFTATPGIPHSSTGLQSQQYQVASRG